MGYTRHFLRNTDISEAEVLRLFTTASELKRERNHGWRRDALAGKHVAIYMEKPSVRTRISFTVGVRELGGEVVELSGTNTKVGSGEHPYDFAKVVSRYCHALVARVFSDEGLAQMAAGSSVPVVNALSDLHHPCQALADYFTIHEKFGTLRGLSLAYVGDGMNNVTHSLLELGSMLGVQVRVACPEGYDPDPQLAARARITHDPAEAVRGAQIVYTDTWVSMGKESEQRARRDALSRYKVDEALLANADPSAVVMHCLPAVRNDEIDEKIMHGPRSIIFDQAENRLHTQKALLLGLMTTKGF